MSCPMKLIAWHTQSSARRSKFTVSSDLAIGNAYEAALCVELALRGIPFVRQPCVTLNYKGHQVGKGWLDILVGDVLIVELKAVEELSDVHTAQVLSYLRAIGQHLGLLMNFNVDPLAKGIRRVIVSS